MDDILERIYQSRIALQKRNETPTEVYLGRDEYTAVMQLARTNGAVTYRTLTVDDRTKVFGMRVFEVDAKNHLRVV